MVVALFQPGDKVLINVSGLDNSFFIIPVAMKRHDGEIMTIRGYGGEWGENESYYMMEDADEYCGNVEPGWVWPEKALLPVRIDKLKIRFSQSPENSTGQYTILELCRKEE